MKMGEGSPESWGMNEELVECLDEFLPEWRDLTPVEFYAKLPSVVEAMMIEIGQIAETVRRLDEQDEQGQSTEGTE